MWAVEGGTASGNPKTSAAISPERPTSYGMAGAASPNPARAHSGKTAVTTSGLHVAAL